MDSPKDGNLFFGNRLIPVPRESGVRRLVAIARVLLLAGFLAGPSWACCCGPNENRCDAPPDPLGVAIQKVRQVWQERARIELTAQPICAPSENAGDCACWKPRQADSATLVAASLPFFDPLDVGSPVVTLVPPPGRAAPPPQVRQSPPPLRPPIEREAWDQAILPLPPPFRT